MTKQERELFLQARELLGEEGDLEIAESRCAGLLGGGGRSGFLFSFSLLSAWVYFSVVDQILF